MDQESGSRHRRRKSYGDGGLGGYSSEDGHSGCLAHCCVCTLCFWPLFCFTPPIRGVDFDDDELPFYEENKSSIKKANEEFLTQFASSLRTGIIGTCALALRETTKPDIKQTKSTLMGTVLRLGDTDTRPEEAFEINVKNSKCTAIARAKSWKKFAMRPMDEEDGMDEADRQAIYAELKMRSEYHLDPNIGEDEDGVKMEVDEENKTKALEVVEKEQLIRGFKYGSTYAPCPDGQFPKLPTRKGIDICGFFKAKNVSGAL